MITTQPAGGIELPVGKIVAVGRNYMDHAREMGADRPDEPLLFLKPSTAIHQIQQSVPMPSFSSSVHHEVEMVIRIGRPGRNMNLEEASANPDAYGVGIDLTARDIQQRAKERGEPWAVAKGFDSSAPLSDLSLIEDIASLSDLEISLEIDGETRQKDNTSSMLFSVPELVAFVSTRFRWEAGDLLFTGTPAGVGPVLPGQSVRACLGSIVLERTFDAGS